MTTIAEGLNESTFQPSAAQRQDTIPHLQEAIGIFVKCLSIQESQYAESEAQATAMGREIAMAETDVPGSPSISQSEVDDPSSPPSIDEQWASIFVPVTTATLFDTCLAYTRTVTSLLAFSGPEYDTVDPLKYLSDDILAKAIKFASDPAQVVELAQARFNLQAALADRSFRTNTCTAPAYAEQLAQSFDEPTLAAHAPGLCDFADAVLTFDSAASAAATDEASSHAPLRWKYLTHALTALATANALPDAENRTAINARRGDAELLRARLGDAPTSYAQALKNRDTLLRNAETYYGGAAKLAGAAGEGTVEAQMRVRGAVASRLRGNGEAWDVLARGGSSEREVVEGTVAEMVEEGLVDEGFAGA